MYALFVEAASGVVPHTFPPLEAVGTKRFLRFDAERRPRLFGAIDTPKTRWRKVLGVMSFGLALIPLRPFVAESARARMSEALEPIRARFDTVLSPHPLWGRLTTALGVYFGGLVALLPMLAWNFWRVERRRSAYWALGLLPLVALGPVNETVAFFALAFAIAVYLGWPLLMPAPARRHLAFGGRTVHVRTAVLAVAAAGGLALFLPHGIPMAVGETERSAVIDVEAVRSILPEELRSVGAMPSLEAIDKTARLDGSIDLFYRFEAPDLVIGSQLLRYPAGALFELAEELTAEFPGFQAEPTSSTMHDGWRLESYHLTLDGEVAGVGVLARQGSVRYTFTLSGILVSPGSLFELTAPRLEAVARVAGIFGS
jgi:hypothetical protein